MSKFHAIKALVLVAFASAFVFSSVDYSHAKLIITERTKYYTVKGKTGKALFRSITRRGPKTKRDGHAIATTETRFKIVNLKIGIKGNRCVVEKLDIRLDLTYTLPRWRKNKRATKKFERNWERFLKLVEKHEATHGRISREYGRRLYSKMSKLSGGVSNGCRDFGKFHKRTLRLAQENFISRHRNFDRREGRASSRIRRLQRALVVSP